MTSANRNPVKISVIIPVYNTEDYVREAIGSVCRQTLPELEIIVMNDGSTDGSLQTIEQLAKEDKRISVFSQTNQGQSVARNNAMKFATGTYLYFMDSDDVIAPEALEACYRKCEGENLDFVFFDADILNKESSLAMSSLSYDRSTGVAESEVHTGITMLQKQLRSRCYTPSPCLNLIRTDFIKKQCLQFYPEIIHEDELFSALLYLHAGRVGYIRQKFFKRRFREASTMTRRFSWRNMNGYLTVSNELLSFKDRANSEQKKTIDLLLEQMLDAAYWNAHALPLRQRLDLFRICFRKRYKRYVSSRTIASMLAKSFVRQ